MVGLAKISIHGIDAGAVSWDPKRRSSYFEFFPSYVARGRDISPIKMPLARSANRVYTFNDLDHGYFNGMPGLLADSLPSGIANRIFRIWLRANGIAAGDLTPPDMLRIIGSSGPGVLDFDPSGPLSFPEPEPLDVEKLQWTAHHLASDKDESIQTVAMEGRLDPYLASLISCGRDHLAAAIALDSESGDIFTGHNALKQLSTDWIVMLTPGNDDQSHSSGQSGRFVYATYLMALDCGIDAAECRLLEINGRSSPMFKRTDRESAGDGSRRIHTQSLSALSHTPPDKRATTSYEMAFQVMRQLRLPHSDAVELFRRLVYALLIGSSGETPATIRYHLDEMGRWHLAPAVLYEDAGAGDHGVTGNPVERKSGFLNINRRLAMRVAGKRESVTMHDLLRVARDISLKNGEEIIIDMIDTLTHWPLYAEEAGLTESISASVEERLTQNIMSLTGTYR